MFKKIHGIHKRQKMSRERVASMAAIAADITATSLIGLQRATAYLIATG
jgi:hypothetical protein